MWKRWLFVDFRQVTPCWPWELHGYSVLYRTWSHRCFAVAVLVFYSSQVLPLGQICLLLICIFCDECFHRIWPLIFFWREIAFYLWSLLVINSLHCVFGGWTIPIEHMHTRSVIYSFYGGIVYQLQFGHLPFRFCCTFFLMISSLSVWFSFLFFSFFVLFGATIAHTLA